MTKTIRGRLLDGRVELLEPLDVPDGTDVRVTYDTAVESPPHRPMRAYYGIFAKQDAPTSDEADWQEAKQIWEPKDQ